VDFTFFYLFGVTIVTLDQWASTISLFAEVGQCPNIFHVSGWNLPRWAGILIVVGQYHNWLLVLTISKKKSMGRMIPYIMEKHVPNHQPDNIHCIDEFIIHSRKKGLPDSEHHRKQKTLFGCE